MDNLYVGIVVVVILVALVIVMHRYCCWFCCFCCCCYFRFPHAVGQFVPLALNWVSTKMLKSMMKSEKKRQISVATTTTAAAAEIAGSTMEQQFKPAAGRFYVYA